MGILFGGYGFILLSYAWVWMIAAGMSRYVSAEGLGRPGKADVKVALNMMALWTLAWALLMVMDCCR